MLDVRRLVYLVELGRRGTIAAVSSALHMSPSGISHQLSLLEREAGVPLLERVGRGVRLTDAGRQLADRGADILAALELAEMEVRSGTAPTGTCRVAAFASAARVLVPVIVACQQQHPQLRIELVESEPEVALPGLLSGDFDVVVSEEYPGTRPAAARHLHREVLATDPLEMVASGTLLDGRDLTRCAESLPWALEPVGAQSRAWAVDHCRARGFAPNVQFESWDLDLLLLLARQGAAASVLPQLALPVGAADTDLVRVPTGAARTVVSLVRQARLNDPSVATVLAAFRAGFEDRTTYRQSQ